MKVRYSRRATTDLASIHEYLKARSPGGALNVMTAIYAAVEFIKRYPDAAELTRIAGTRKDCSQISFQGFLSDDCRGRSDRDRAYPSHVTTAVDGRLMRIVI